MCELLAVAADRPLSFGEILPWARELERLGVAGFGWGVAWRGDDGVRRYRNPGRLADDVAGAERASHVTSDRFLVHLRRPSRLSTVQLADSQPFLAAAEEDGVGPFAFCHNGFLKRHGELRGGYEGRLQGRADSEVGLVLLGDLLAGGTDPADALTAVHHRLEGTANFSYLDRQGRVVVYGGHDANPLWTFTVGEMSLAATAIHSADESVFDLIFRDATERREVTGAAPLEPRTADGAEWAAARRDGTG